MLQLTTWWQKALVGMVGALANEILRIYLVAVGQQHGILIPSSLGVYFTATLLYLVLAGTVTILWDDPNPIKCLAIGVGLPRIIQTLTQTAVQVPKVSLILPLPESLLALIG